MEDLSIAHVVTLLPVAGALLYLVAGLIRPRNRQKKEARSGQIKRVREVGSFDTRDPRERLIKLTIFQEYLDAGTRGDPHAERKGRTRIMTMDGRHVDKVATRKYRVMGTTDVLTTDDFGAP